MYNFGLSNSNLTREEIMSVADDAAWPLAMTAVSSVSSSEPDCVFADQHVKYIGDAVLALSNGVFVQYCLDDTKGDLIRQGLEAQETLIDVACRFVAALERGENSDECQSREIVLNKVEALAAAVEAICKS